MSTALAALIAVAAFTITYFTCVRPMRRGAGRTLRPATPTNSTGTSPSSARN
jgi:hypothetical protein